MADRNTGAQPDQRPMGSQWLAANAGASGGMIPGPMGPAPGWSGMMPGFGGMMPGGSGILPGVGAGTIGWGSPYAGMNGAFMGQLSAVLRAIDACLTMASVIFSLITQALRDETLQNLREMRPFTDAFGDYLQALMISAGTIRRLLGGQWTPELLAILREQLQTIPSTHQSLMTTWQQLSRQQSVQQSPTMQSLAQALAMAQPLQQQLLAALQPLLPPTGTQQSGNTNPW